MPLLGTAGAASAKGFGLFRQASGGAGYAYVGMYQPLLQNALGGANPLSMSYLPVQPGSGSINRQGVVADGQFIVYGESKYSTNNGASWVDWQSLTVGQYTGTGLNSVIAYNSVQKCAATWGYVFDPKTSYYYITVYMLLSTGVKNSSSFSVIGQGRSILYAPALSYFYLMNIGTSLTNGRGVNWTGTNFSVTVGQPGNYRAGVSSDGYPIQAFLTGGTTYQLRKYLSADFSSYSSYGNISDSYASNVYQSPWVWCPINGRYYVAAGSATSGVVTIRRSSGSSDPHLLTYSGNFTIPGAGSLYTINILETSTGVLCVFGQYNETGVGAMPFTYYSSDAGVTWTRNSSSPAATISKNFT